VGAVSCIVVGVAGGSASGKSTVVDGLSGLLTELGVSILRHDAYYHDLSHLPLVERRTVNVDHPDSLDTRLFMEDLDALRRGESIRMPAYDYVSQTRGRDGIEVWPARVVLVEGLFVLTDPVIRSRCDLLVFVDATESERLARRIDRDGAERGKSADEVRQQHVVRVEPMHRQFVHPGLEHAEVTIEGGGHNREAMQDLAERVRRLARQGV
jgi:uridine kinase